MRIRSLIFLRDVFLLAITTFGGPQAHIGMFVDRLVRKRGYLTEEELMELYALCQILPGPTSTQTITAIGYKRGGAQPGLSNPIDLGFPSSHDHDRRCNTHKPSPG